MAEYSNRAGRWILIAGGVVFVAGIGWGLKGGVENFATSLPWRIMAGGLLLAVVGVFARIVGGLLLGIAGLSLLTMAAHFVLGAWMRIEWIYRLGRPFLPLPGMEGVGGFYMGLLIVFFAAGLSGALLIRSEDEEWAAVEVARENRHLASRAAIIQCSACGWEGTLGTFNDQEGCPRCANQRYQWL